MKSVSIKEIDYSPGTTLEASFNFPEGYDLSIRTFQFQISQKNVVIFQLEDAPAFSTDGQTLSLAIDADTVSDLDDGDTFEETYGVISDTRPKRMKFNITVLQGGKPEIRFQSDIVVQPAHGELPE